MSKNESRQPRTRPVSLRRGWLARIAIATLTRGAAVLMVLGASFIATPSAAQEPRATQGNEALWFKSQTWDYLGTEKRFGYSFDIIVRRQSAASNANIFQHRQRESFRPWFGWMMDSLNRLAISPLSYHYDVGVLTDDFPDPRPRHELRSTLEFDSSAFVGKIVMFSHRYRLEFRNFREVGSDEWSFVVRLRLRLRLRVVLNQRTYYDNGAIYGFGYNEVAVNYRPSGTAFSLNQNRAFIGLGHRFEKYLRVELGYVNYWVVRSSFDEYFRAVGPMLYFNIDYLSALIRAKTEEARRRAAERRVEVDPSGRIDQIEYLDGLPRLQVPPSRGERVGAPGADMAPAPEAFEDSAPEPASEEEPQEPDAD